jgi:hypothetical protein
MVSAIKAMVWICLHRSWSSSCLVRFFFTLGLQPGRGARPTVCDAGVGRLAASACGDVHGDGWCAADTSRRISEGVAYRQLCTTLNCSGPYWCSAVCNELQFRTNCYYTS